MTDGDSYEIDYQFETRGSYTLESASNPRDAPKQTIPGLTSEQACEQAAITIVNEVSQPLWEVEFAVPPQEVGFAVTDALQVPGLPISKPVEVQNVTNSPDLIAVTGGTRQTVGEVVRQIRERVGQVARRS